MTILLMVLKVIGIILLILLGLVLLALFLGLVVPVRYEFKGNFKDKDTYDFSLRISWLLRLVQFRLSGYNKAITNRVTILGIRLKKKEKAKTKNKKIKSDEDDKSIKKVSRNDESLQEKTEPDKIPNKEQKEDYSGCEADTEPCDEQKGGIFTKIKNLVRMLIQKVKQTFRNICDRIKSIDDKIKKADEFLHDEKNILVFNLVKGEVFRLLHHYGPRKWRGKLLLGTGDPATTGWTIGIIYALYPIHAGNLCVTPDFDNKVLEGTLFIRGKIRGVHAVFTVLRLLKNKYFRNMIFKKNGGQKSGRE